MSTLLTLIQMFWPFLKETLFGRASFRTWLKSNRLTLFWVCMMFIMLFVVIRLTSIIKELSNNLHAIQLSNKAVVATNKAVLLRLQWSEDEVDALNAEVLWTRHVFMRERISAPEVNHKPIPTPQPPNRNQALIDRLNRWQSPHEPATKPTP